MAPSCPVTINVTPDRQATTTTTTTVYSTTTATSISYLVATYTVPKVYTPTILSTDINKAVVHSKQGVTVTLGALLGLLSLLLLMVSTVWVCTYWTTKKKAMLEQAR